MGSGRSRSGSERSQGQPRRTSGTGPRPARTERYRRRPRRKSLHLENVRCCHYARELAKTNIMVILAVVVILHVDDVEQ